MKCSNCRMDILDNARFCSSCGAPQVVPGKFEKLPTTKEKSINPIWIMLGFFVVAVVAIIGLSARYGGDPSTTGSAQQAWTEEAYESELGALEVLVQSGTTSDVVASIKRLENAPNEDLKERLRDISQSAGTSVSDSGVLEIMAEEVDLEAKLKKLESLRTEINRDFGLSAAAQSGIEDAALSLVKPLPAAMLKENVQGYETLKRIAPQNVEYAEKYDAYLAKFRAAEQAEVERAAAELKRKRSAILSKYRKQEDKFNGTTFYTHPNSPRYTNSRSTVYLYLGSSSGRFFLRMKTLYTAEDWLFVESVQGYANGASFNLTGGRFERDNDSTIWEWLDEVPSALQIDRLKVLSEASDATLRYEGNQYRKDIKLSSADRTAIRQVLADFEELKELD